MKYDNKDYLIAHGGKMEAEKLRIGEERRDASTKIRGFLYQDLLTLKVLVEASSDSRVFSEWVEDIYLENDNEIKIIQAKYYPSSTVKFSEIYEDIYFQFLKVKLYKIDKLVTFACYYHGDTSYSKDVCVSSFTHVYTDKKLSDNQIDSLLDDLKKCTNMQERKKLVFANMNTLQHMNEFNLQTIKTESIDSLYTTVKDSLFNEYKDIGILSRINSVQAKDILISIFISLVQSKYYSGSELIEERYIDKNKINSYLRELLETEDEVAYKTLIIAVVNNVIDQVFKDILDETADDQEVLNEYERLSNSTKKYFGGVLETRVNRYKFINTICMDSHDELNFGRYNSLSYNEEYEYFIENKLRIRSFIKTLWKIIYSQDMKLEVENVLKVNDDYIEFYHENESSEFVLLSSEFSSEATREYRKLLGRIKKYKTRPYKWYMRRCRKGIHNYEFDVNDVDIDKLDIGRIQEDDSFLVECMKCVKCDFKQMDKKDNLNDSIFSDRCVEDHSDTD